MVEYKCEKCKKIFNKKSNYINHLKRKTPCELNEDYKNNSDNSRIPENDSKITPANDKNQNKRSKKSGTKYELILKDNKKCKYCEQEFTRIYNLKRHMKGRCKKKQEQEIKKKDEKDDLIKKLLEENKEIKEMLKKLNEKENKQEINNGPINKGTIINNNNNNTMNINLNLVAFGENCDWIPENKCKWILDRGFNSPLELVEYVHFNKNKPEYQNVYISNMQNKYGIIYDGKKWKMEEKEDILEKIWDDKTLFLKNKYNELKSNLNAETIRKFTKFLEEYEEDRVKNLKKDEIKKILYNNRKITLETKRKKAINE